MLPIFWTFFETPSYARVWGNFELPPLIFYPDRSLQPVKIQGRTQKSAGKLSQDTFSKWPRFFTAPPRIHRGNPRPVPEIRRHAARGPSEGPQQPQQQTRPATQEKRRTESAPRSSAAGRTDTNGRRERRNAARLQIELTPRTASQPEEAPPLEELQQEPHKDTKQQSWSRYPGRPNSSRAANAAPRMDITRRSNAKPRRRPAELFLMLTCINTPRTAKTPQTVKYKAASKARTHRRTCSRSRATYRAS